MTIDQGYQLLKLVYNKSQSGNLSPSQFNLAAEVCQISVLNELLGNEAEYQPGMPIPKTGYSINQKNREELRNLIKPLQTITVTAGLMAYPADYVYYDSITTIGGRLITEATPDEIAILNQSQIMPPSLTYPRMTLYSDGIRIAPSSITSVKLTYVRQPATPVWAYTTVNNEPVYDAGNSVDWELSELTHLRICMLVAQYFGLNLNMLQLTQYAAAAEAQGQ